MGSDIGDAPLVQNNNMEQMNIPAKDKWGNPKRIRVFGKTKHRPTANFRTWLRIRSRDYFDKCWNEMKEKLEMIKEQKAHGSVATEAKLIDNSLENNHFEEKKDETPY